MLIFNNFKLISTAKLVIQIEELKIVPGAFIYIKGGSSSGKSLLLSAINGSYSNYKGVITFKDKKLKPDATHNNILLINNELHVIENMTFLQNIEIPIMKNSPIVKKRLIEMAGIVEIIDLFNVKMVNCSRSEKMLMYLIRAALVDPYVLLIDDFDTFFDSEKLKNVQKLLAYFLSTGMSIIATGKLAMEHTITYKINKGFLEQV
ncbi:MAG: ATP-binding cassette domain-containing protein [Candidatus Cloacimonetes bacterium]|nr:ATP-binding cassette domain-containing protein [Candidatus Cloacimonadota bacterium]